MLLRTGLAFLLSIGFLNLASMQASAQTGVVPPAKASGNGTLVVCKEIDDDWKCVGESAQWPANTPFNVLFSKPDPIGVNSIGIVIHKQGRDGKDADFINEYQQTIDEKSKWYATVGETLKLPAGVYSIYIIRWDQRELTTHHGNFKEYFAKTTLTVK